MDIRRSLSPSWLRRDHPVVERYLRHNQPKRLQLMILSFTLALYLLLGGLSLPVIYGLFSLVILLQMTVNTVDKVHSERAAYTWDLVRLTPFSQRELLLSLWAASLWQLQRTWLMRFYLMLHGMIIIGIMVHTIVFTDPHVDQALLLLVIGTFLIVLQPYTLMYFSGMLSLAIANRVPVRGSAHGFAVAAVLLYWLAYVASALAFVLFEDFRLTSGQLMNVLLVPLLIPALLGWFALQIAESSLS